MVLKQIEENNGDIGIYSASLSFFYLKNKLVSSNQFDFKTFVWYFLDQSTDFYNSRNLSVFHLIFRLYRFLELQKTYISFITQISNLSYRKQCHFLTL